MVGSRKKWAAAGVLLLLCILLFLVWGVFSPSYERAKRVYEERHSEPRSEQEGASTEHKSDEREIETAPPNEE
jgi:hypothetical protein